MHRSFFFFVWRPACLCLRVCLLCIRGRCTAGTSSRHRCIIYFITYQIQLVCVFCVPSRLACCARFVVRERVKRSAVVGASLTDSFSQFRYFLGSYQHVSYVTCQSMRIDACSIGCTFPPLTTVKSVTKKKGTLGKMTRQEGAIKEIGRKK